MTKYEPTLSRDDDGTLLPSPGCDIFTAATLAIARSRDMGVTEKLKFNGVVLYIDVFSDAARVADEYRARHLTRCEEAEAVTARALMLEWEARHALGRARLIEAMFLAPAQARVFAYEVGAVLRGKTELTEAEYWLSRLAAEIDPGPQD